MIDAFQLNSPRMIELVSKSVAEASSDLGILRLGSSLGL